MKKITLFLVFVLTVVGANSQVFGKKQLQKHESEPGYFWFKPVVDVDTTTLVEGDRNFNTVFLVEAYLSNGEPIQVLIKGAQLKFLMRLPSKQKVEEKPVFTGFMFTVKSLGQKSILKKKDIGKKGTKFFEKQKDRLLREKDTEKYELWSESPTKVEGHLIGKKILPVTDEAKKEEPDTPPEKVQKPTTPTKKTW
ncbi:MAG TPA: hypothetical protein PLQ20_00905 [Candidatus Paceibacterota bacterium]|nr:hypothetical protein [Candidatus Paceibacterota bacterium]